MIMDLININHIQAFMGNQQLVNLKVSIFSLGTFLDTLFGTRSFSTCT